MNHAEFDLFKTFIKIGGLTEEVDEKVLRAAFIPFGEISEVQLPVDYQTEKHRGFAFIDFELPEDAQAAIDNMHESELFGRVLRVNLAKPMRLKENALKPVWADEEWLQMYAGKTENNAEDGATESTEKSEPEENNPKEAAKRAASDAIEAASAASVSLI